MGDIVKIPIGTVGDIDLSFTGGKLQLAVELSLLQVLQGIRAKSTNALENSILDAAIAALGTVAPSA